MNDDDMLSRLLSGRPGLSRPEKESILDDVLDEVVPAAELEPQRRSWLGIAFALAAAAAAVLLISVAPAPRADDRFEARGAATGPQLTAVCAATPTPGRCNAGGELLFELADAGRWNHVALFAFRADGTAIWYAPDHATGRSDAIEPAALVLLPRRVKLGSEHPPGRYTVAAVLSERPLRRPEIKAIYENPEAHPDARVVETEVTVR